MLSELENKENIKMFCPYEIDSFSEQQTDCNIGLKPNDKKKSKIRAHLTTTDSCKWS